MIFELGILTIKFDVLLMQFINIGILYFLFKKMFGKTLINEVVKRREQTKKLQMAQQEYDEMIAKAKAEKDAIIDEAISHKQTLIAEAVLVAKKEKSKILHSAQEEAEIIVEAAKKKAENTLKELESSWVASVTQTAGVMLKTIFKKDVQLQQDYVATVLKDLGVQK